MKPTGTTQSGDAQGTEPSGSGERLDQFRALVLGDVALQEELGGADDARAFAALVANAGRRNGFQFGPEDVHSAMQIPPRANDPIDPRLCSIRLPPTGWLPIQARWQDGNFFLDWAYFGKERLCEPFYADSVQRRLTEPFNQLFRRSTPFAALEGWLQTRPSLQPSGFIFHLSRCGSTLVAQTLAALPRAVVISEADPIDAVVRAREQRPDLGEEEQGNWLKWIVGAFGQQRCGEERHLFIKLDSWHTRSLPLFRRAFPSVPWIFLYRDPVEVLVSQLRQPGLHMVPGLFGSVFGVEPSYVAEDYRACVLAKVCEPVLQHYREGESLLVDYRELPSAVWTAIMPHFGADCDERDRTLMARAAQRDAKAPSFSFSPDSEAKQRAASPEARHAADKWLSDIHRRLESLRLNAL
jgi:hypothetical protein